MKLTKKKFVEIRKVLKPIYLIVLPVKKDANQRQPEQMEKPEFPETQISLIKGNDFSPISIIDKFSLVRDEINSNLSMPIENDYKKLYLQEIYNFYSEIEEGLVEDEYGNLSTHLDKLVKTNLNLELFADEYEEFLKNLKDNLRNEIKFVDDKVQQLTKDDNNIPSTYQSSGSGITWEKNKIDLIELIIALHETKSIFKDNVPMNQIEMISVFSDIFRFDLSDYEKDLSQAKIKRKKRKALFLNKLKIAFENYCLKEG